MPSLREAPKASRRETPRPAPWPTERVLLLGALMFVVLSSLYSAANVLHWREPAVLPWTIVDRAVPFVDWTVWIYLSHFAMQGWLVWESARARDPRPLFAVALSAAISISIFFAFPTTTGAWPWAPGPVSALGFNLLSRLNTPANSLPSMHVSLAALAAATVARVRPSRTLVAIAWACAVIASTLTAKQHTAVDVPAGLAVAWLSWRITR